MPRDIFATTKDKGGATGINWVEVRDANKHPTMLKKVPDQQRIIWSRMSIVPKLRNPDMYGIPGEQHKDSIQMMWVFQNVTVVQEVDQFELRKVQKDFLERRLAFKLETKYCVQSKVSTHSS